MYEPTTGELFDSNTRYWLNKLYGHEAQSVKGLTKQRGSFYADIYGKKIKQKGGEKAYETWQRVTGTPWAEAKKQGLTDGSYKGNLALQQKLFKQLQQPTVEPTVKPSVKQQTQQQSEYNFDNLTFNEAFGKAREMYGANKIFKYKGHLKNTNRSGEPFEPSEEELTKWGMNKKSKKQNIKKQNEIIESPYTSQDDFNTAALSTATDAEDRFLREKDFKPQPISKDEYLQQQGQGEYEYWEDVKQEQKDINKMDNAAVVVNHQKNKAKSDYVVIDKSKGLMHLYHPKQDKPYLTYPIDLGSNVGDGQTVTKTKDLDGDGKITTKDKSNGKYKVDWDAGNKSTGAGKFYISNLRKEGYAGLPSFNMMNEAQYNEYKKSGKIERVSTSIHSGYVSDDEKRVSNGCIRCTKGAVDNLYSVLKGGSEVFILPEEKQNKFYVKDDKLYFKNKNRNKYFTYKDGPRIYKKENKKWFISDKNNKKFSLLKNFGGMYDELDKKAVDLQYDVYEDKNGNIQKGQGINRTPGNKNYRPIKIDIDRNLFIKDKDERRYKEIVVPYAEAIEDNKKKIMDIFNITSDQYNDLVPVAMGILGNETGFGDEFSSVGDLARAVNKGVGSILGYKASSPDYKSKYYTYGANKNENSVGLTQFRWQYMKEGDLNKKMSKLGVYNNEDLLNPKKAAIHAMGRLAFLIKNRTFNKELDFLDTVPGMWGGSSSDNKATYTSGVKNNSKYFNVLQYKKKGGETFRVYKDYISGIDESDKARNTFDKLNRVYYSKAKQNKMSPSDYIMTYLIK